MTPGEIAGIVLAGAAFAVALASLVSGRARYKRLARRLDRWSGRSARLRSEILPLLRPLYHDLLDRKAPGHGSAIPRAVRGETGEDMLLLALFAVTPQGVPGPIPTRGFFVEAGGFDGRLNSPTWLFESLGWKGLIVEPVKSLAQQARDARPGSRVVHGALGRRDATGHVRIRVFDPDQSDGGRTDLASHIVGAGDGTIARPSARTASEQEVAVTSLARLLREPESGAPDRIDLIVLDIEGAEIDALDGLELESNPPRVLVVEDHAAGDEHPAYLARFGYTELVRLDFNRIYAHESEVGMIRFARETLALDQVGIA